MNTDRELLELAAKAAGLTIEHWAQDDYAVVRDGAAKVGWSPLVFDSDALRLAVKLGLTVCNEHESAGVVYCTRAYTEEFPAITSGKVGDPPGITEEDYAATRRAIVRAAAAIGAST